MQILLWCLKRRKLNKIDIAQILPTVSESLKKKKKKDAAYVLDS